MRRQRGLEVLGQRVGMALGKKLLERAVMVFVPAQEQVKLGIDGAMTVGEHQQSNAFFAAQPAQSDEVLPNFAPNVVTVGMGPATVLGPDRLVEGLPDVGVVHREGTDAQVGDDVIAPSGEHDALASETGQLSSF